VDDCGPAIVDMYVRPSLLPEGLTLSIVLAALLHPADRGDEFLESSPRPGAATSVWNIWRILGQVWKCMLGCWAHCFWHFAPWHALLKAALCGVKVWQ